MPPVKAKSQPVDLDSDDDILGFDDEDFDFEDEEEEVVAKPKKASKPAVEPDEDDEEPVAPKAKRGPKAKTAKAEVAVAEEVKPAAPLGISQYGTFNVSFDLSHPKAKLILSAIAEAL